MRNSANASSATSQFQTELSRWDNEGGAERFDELRISQLDDGQKNLGSLAEIELRQLRIRVIALENLVISLLAKSSDQQISLAREMALTISPRPGYTQHKLTIRAARHILDLVKRSNHFRRVPRS
jgi:hypothetical protein